MSALDVSVQFCRDTNEWSIPGHSPEITSFLLEAPDLPIKVLRSFWSSNHHIYRFGQCIYDNVPLPWGLIKAHQNLSKKDRTPLWFDWIMSIIQHLPPIQSELQASQIHAPSTDRRRKEWVSFISLPDNVSLGKIVSKSKNSRTITITHWSSANNDFSFKACNGCTLSSWQSDIGECQIQKSRSSTSTIPTRLISYNKSKGVVTTISFHPQKVSSRRLPPLPIIPVDSLDIQLIKSALADNTARTILIDRLLEITAVSLSIARPSSIDIYTDGSLSLSKFTADDAAIMGSGWYIPDFDIQYGCATTSWPSSTKAELIAIWTAVLAIPSVYGKINIFTDSQAAIDGITNSTKDTWTIRQYLKTPNAMIIEQIIKTVSTKGQSIQLTKVKGHSGNVFNDVADEIANRAVITAHQDPAHFLLIQHHLMQSRLHFKLYWRNTPWDGKL